jgi:hypothetical protein
MNLLNRRKPVTLVLISRSSVRLTRIRLRSSILALRERILSWAERQSHLLSTKPPNSGEASETDLSALEDEVDKGVRADDGEEDTAGTGMGWKGRVVNSMRGTLNELDL